MSVENTSSFEAMNTQVDSAVRMSLRKPAAAFAAGIALVIGGAIDNSSEQPMADHLAAQVDGRLDDLGSSEAVVVSDYLRGEGLPKDTEASLVRTAKSIGELSNRQREKDGAGNSLIGVGMIIGLWSGMRVFTNKLGGSHIKTRLSEVHPDLAPKRLVQETKQLFESGNSVETSDQFIRKHRGWSLGQGAWDRHERQLLQEIGRDIEISGEFTQNESQRDHELTEYLNKAQWKALLDSGYDTTEEVAGADDLELYKVSIIDDLWKPEDTFTSLTDWYVYRRRQVVKPHAFHKVEADDLFLPELEARSGGIGVALGRVAYYVRLMKTSGADRKEKGTAMVFATEGARVLDEVAPRNDSTYWFDHIQNLERKTFSTAES